MDEQTKELIASGASVSAHCQPRVTYHVGKARDLGIGEGLILEAVTVGQMVEKGAGSAMRDFARTLLGKPSAGACCRPEKGRLDACGGRAAPLRLNRSHAAQRKCVTGR